MGKPPRSWGLCLHNNHGHTGVQEPSSLQHSAQRWLPLTSSMAPVWILTDALGSRKYTS